MTSTTTHTEMIQACYDAFSRGDIQYILDHLTSDCRWVVAGEGIPMAGVYIGPAGAADFFQKLSQSEEVLRFDVHQIIADGDTVVGLGYEEVRVPATGKHASGTWAMLFKFSGDKVCHFETFYNTAAYAIAHQA